MSKPDPALFFRDVALPNFMENKDQLNHPVRVMIAEEAAKVGRTVLDVGCNTCIDYPFMKAKELIYTGIDFQEKFVKRAKELYPEVDARVADATSIPFVSRSYDTGYAKDLFEHLPPLGQEPNYQTAIKEIWRVTDRLMMLALFHEPISGVYSKTIVSYHAAGFWDNTYSKSEINSCLVDLEDVEHIEYREKIGSNYLYIVKKRVNV